MNTYESKRLPVVPNHQQVALPDLEIKLYVSNNYDTNLFSNLKENDEFIMAYALSDNAYGDFDNLILPGVKSIGTLCKISKIEIQKTGFVISAFCKDVVDLQEFAIDNDTKTIHATCFQRTQFVRPDNLIYEKLGHFTANYSELKNKYPKLPPLPDFSQTVKEINYIPYHIAAFLDSSVNTKMRLLEEKDVIEKFKIVSKELERFNLDAKVEFDINQMVSQNLDKNQREYVLREKMKVVKNQLKEFDGDDKDTKYEKAISEHAENYPENILTRIKNELTRFKSMPSMSQETPVIQGYLDLLVDLPWKISSTDKEDLNEVTKVLEKNHNGLEKQKERILQYLAVKQLTKSLKAPILCFYGAPGVGKTSLAISIAEALGRNFVKVALGGISDEAEIRGHRKTYLGAMPGKIISSINKCKTNNPVFLLDEIDKINGGGYHGDPASALLEVLDPEQNKFFVDNYLDEPFDLSNVLFICTANDVSKIPVPLLDRLEMIELNTYTKFEKKEIAKKHLIKLEEENNGIKENMMTWTDDALDYIIEFYTMEAGVRNLRRKIGTIDRKFAVDYLQKPEENEKITIDVDTVKKYLGAEIFLHDHKLEDSQIGIINGLAYTDSGGEVLRIEVNTFPGKGGLILTGNLGDVMKEACETALSYVRSIGPELGIHPEFFAENDIHIHFPESATPKDGPSAGIATALCIISAICHLRIRNDIAMTGEIDLRGNALPIGGLREKTNAASREHLKTVFVPKENNKDILELPKEITDSLEIVTVNKLKDMFDKVFLEDIAKEKDRIAKITCPEKKDKDKKSDSKSKKSTKK